MKIYRMIKTIVFIILGVLAIVFSHELVSQDGAYINALVASVMILYGVEGGIMNIIKKDVKAHPVKFLNNIIMILMAVILLVIVQGHEYELVMGCVIWSVWSIMREGEEIAEKVIERFDNKVTAIINFLESIIVIVFSILLIAEPGIHHAHTHVILLGVELILEVLWPYLDELEGKIKASHHNK